jgi:thioesterase domain-containing protein
MYGLPLSSHIDPAVSVYGLPASSMEQAQLRTMEAMAMRMAGMIREAQPSGPYRLAGWSFGGVLAYEIATQLIGADEEVEFLGLFDSIYVAGTEGATALSHDEFNSKDVLLSLVESQAQNNPSFATDEALQTAISRLKSNAPAMDLATLVGKCQEMSLAPEGWNHLTIAQVEQILARIHSYNRALFSYSAQRLPIAIHIFAAQDNSFRPFLGWNAVLPEDRIRATTVPGTHMSMMAAPDIEMLGNALSRAIRTSAAGPGESHDGPQKSTCARTGESGSESGDRGKQAG